MRYGSYASEDCQPEQKWHATVQNDEAIESQRLALRHARAMAAVIRAAKAWQRGYAKFEANSMSLATLRMRLNAATKRLVAVEKEVKRGK